MKFILCKTIKKVLIKIDDRKKQLEKEKFEAYEKVINQQKIFMNFNDLRIKDKLAIKFQTMDVKRFQVRITEYSIAETNIWKVPQNEFLLRDFFRFYQTPFDIFQRIFTILH
jgi:prenyltransferase beta subunit